MKKTFGKKTRKASLAVMILCIFFLLNACDTSSAKDIYRNTNDSEAVNDFVQAESVGNENAQDQEVEQNQSKAQNEETDAIDSEVGENTLNGETNGTLDEPVQNQEETPESNKPMEDETQENDNQVVGTSDEETTQDTEEEERTIDKEGKMVALTFDDGPSANYTRMILDILKAHNARATFFELGYLAEIYPELVLAEYEAGHEIGNHSFTHINMKTFSYDQVISEINRTNDVLEGITGAKPIFVRPPYGNLNKEALADSGMYVILWSVDTRDWESKDEEKIMEVVKEKANLDGHVILMHSTQRATASVLEELLLYLEENGYQCVTISELLTYKYGIEPEVGKTYGYTFFHSAQNKK